MRKKTGAICITISMLFLALFIYLQLQLPGKISGDLYVSSSIQSYYDTSDLISESSIASSDSTPQPIQSDEPKATESVKFFSPTGFHPVGLPFNRKNWYQLFRHYQNKQYNASTFPFQHYLQEAMKSSSPWTLLPNNQLDILFIKESCIDIRHRMILIMDPSSSNQFEKKHLRNPETIESHIYSPVQIPGFESYPLYQVNASIPISIPIHSTNLSWILATPPSSNDECLQSFMQYIPVFLQSISPFFQIDVSIES